jgi:hypothetical protein
MRRHLLIIEAVFFAVIWVTGSAIHKSYATLNSSQGNRIFITNETEALQVNSFKISQHDLIVELKNRNGRSVIAYAFDTKLKKGVTVDLTFTENGFPPSATHHLRVPLDNLEYTEDLGLYKLNFSLALFDDGSAEGDWEQARIHRIKLEGVALALNQIQSKLLRIKRFSSPAIESFSSEIRVIIPPKSLTAMQKNGYQNAVLQSLAKAQVILQSQSQDKADRNLNEFKNSTTRQVSLIHALFN